MKNIIIDLLGSDNSESELLEGVFLAKREYPSYSFTLIGDKKDILEQAKRNGFVEEDFHYIDCNVALTNLDNPKDIIKKDNASSLALALDYLKNDENSIGIISSGSTGALLVGSIFRLGLIDGVKIPLLACKLLSFSGKPLVLLDCGANLSFDLNSYLKAAKLGSSLALSFKGVSSPRVGLINVGKEKGKGNDLLKDAYSILENEKDVNFIGNLEGHDIFNDKCDVAICEGYVGNVILKLAESMGMFAVGEVNKLENPESKNLSNKFFKNFAYTELGASILLGPKKICLKCHGSVSRNGIYNTVGQLIELYEGDFINNLKNTFTR